MTKRQKIFETLKFDLLKIKPENGYLHNIDSVYPVVKTISDVSNYPEVNLLIGDEEIHTDFEDRNLLAYSLHMKILTHIETEYDLNSEGCITTEADAWIEDYEKFTACERADNGCTLCLIPGVQNYYISKIEPFNDWRDNKQTLEVTITVEYLNNY